MNNYTASMHQEGIVEIDSLIKQTRELIPLFRADKEFTVSLQTFIDLLLTEKEDLQCKIKHFLSTGQQQKI